MPFTVNPADRVDDLARAAVGLLDADDIRSLTVRRLAEAARVSPSALIAHFENKERILVLVTRRIGDWLVEAIALDVRDHGSGGVLPHDSTRPLVRAWLGLTELARSYEVLGLHIAEAELEIAYQLRASFGLVDKDDVIGPTLVALVNGLWMRMCAPADPMSHEHALTILRDLCGRIGVPLRAGTYGRTA
ncbi:hypothetical protein GCM10009795_016230 [Nocardioides hankookensis]|uniref:TetR family transcriptional regulator n=1 Tax=Nocardioides hankookensis TaxID=443157 RepID=A0ABW1LKI8_9ACTN